jgi:hypothetical protein
VPTLGQLLPALIILGLAVKQPTEFLNSAFQLDHQPVYVLEAVVAKGKQVLVQALQGVQTVALGHLSCAMGGSWGGRLGEPEKRELEVRLGRLKVFGGGVDAFSSPARTRSWRK